MPRKKLPADKPLSIEKAGGKIAKAMSDSLAGNDPGTISFRLKPTKKPGETYPLKLTELQRESLIHCTRIQNKIKERLKAAGEGTQIVGVTRKELDHLNDEIGEAAVYAPSPHKKRLVAVLHKVTELFAEDRAGLFGDRNSQDSQGCPEERQPAVPVQDHAARHQTGDLAADSGSRLHPRQSPRVHPSGVRLVELPPAPVPDRRQTLRSTGSRGFRFRGCMVDESGVLLSKLIPKSGRRSRWIYEYDFGDGWRHEVLFEGFPPADPKAKYPLCLEGERACPPEDCGGPGGYAEYLAAIADPRDEQHEEMLQWRGPFDPEAFDAKKVDEGDEEGDVMPTTKQIDAILPYLDRFIEPGFTVGDWCQFFGSGTSPVVRVQRLGCEVPEGSIRQLLDHSIIRLGKMAGDGTGIR